MNAEVDRRLRVLVVDDKAFVRTMTGRVLQSAGVESVVYAAGGKEAIQYIKQTSPRISLVFCDLMMPDMDGVEVVRHVAELEHKPAFVFVSGANAALLSTAADMARARGLLVLGSIEKPISIEAVRGMLSRLDSARPARTTAPRLALTAADLKGGLEADQIALHYQPKINVRSRSIEGFECLARWRHPDHGLVPPGQFVALAEESGLIKPLTDRVLSLALRQCAAWNAIGFTTKLSINISAHLLIDLGMPDRIAKEASEHGLDPHQIVLEITETGVFQDAADTLDILARLHMKGFALSIDDFGTGYSSMEQLRRIPFAELKIDRAFVNGAGQNQKAKAILQSSAALGHNLGLSVVAEGAETQEDWDLLASLGVDVVQGYFIAKPMPVDGVLAWREKWNGNMAPKT
ncbi:MAG: EAL domain-containing response regulator [Proteobacteria bacterium]|nr:EAL domain-containing response regulator [Pseudomonadota bacterium]